MDANEILQIIKAFFNAILNIFRALGIVKEEATTAAPEEEESTPSKPL